MNTPLSTAQPDLFGSGDVLPPGFVFTPGFVTPAEEAALIALAATLPFAEARYHQYTARRRVVAWGSARHAIAGDEPNRQPLHALPAPLAALRTRLAAWASLAADEIVQVLMSEYRPGTPLGWHRDAPQYELIAGVSLGGPARLRLRPWPPESGDRDDVISLDLAPRSAYRMSGAARWGWQHGLPPVPALRWSVTMRSARASAIRPSAG